MNFRFPVFLDLNGKKCLAVGEGYELPMKVQALVDAGAETIYVNPTADPRIEALATAGLIQWHKRGFQKSDLDGCFLIITDQEDNSEVFKLAEQQHILCNAVDDPEHCRFSFGSVHRQGDLTIAISTNGWAPAVAVRLKEMLQREVGPEYGVLLSILKRIRPKITVGVPTFSDRRDLWYRIVDSNALDLIRAGQQQEAEARIERFVAAAINNTSRSDTFGGGDGH